MATLEFLLNDASTKASTYVSAYNEGGKRKSELQALKKQAMAAMDSYNLELSKNTYKQWNDEGNPVLTAVRLKNVPSAKKIKFTTDDYNQMSFTMAEAEYRVSLPMMQKVLGTEVFADPKWFHKAEMFAYQVAMRLNKTLGDSANFRYEIDKVSREFSFPDGIDPLTDEGAIHALQIVIDSILFIDDPDNPGKNKIATVMKQDAYGYYSEAWSFVREGLTYESRDEIFIKNSTKFISLILGAMNKMLNKEAFTLIAEAPEKIVNDEEKSEPAETPDSAPDDGSADEKPEEKPEKPATKRRSRKNKTEE